MLLVRIILSFSKRKHIVNSKNIAKCCHHYYHHSLLRLELISISGARDHAHISNKDSLGCGNKYVSSGYRQELHPICEELAKDIGHYWCGNKYVSSGYRRMWVCIGNEAADELAGRNCDLPSSSPSLFEPF
ncbi:hypothetical protein TNCV_1155921 [Trichonephila clavipes]|nr:hypothetical protein TNCV_1155921 [Trichonephila clavipes]